MLLYSKYSCSTFFESEKLGRAKIFRHKFYFMDEEKTLTDKEIDGMMNKLIRSFETELNA